MIHFQFPLKLYFTTLANQIYKNANVQESYIERSIVHFYSSLLFIIIQNKNMQVIEIEWMLKIHITLASFSILLWPQTFTFWFLMTINCEEFNFALLYTNKLARTTLYFEKDQMFRYRSLNLPIKSKCLFSLPFFIKKISLKLFE